MTQATQVSRLKHNNFTNPFPKAKILRTIIGLVFLDQLVEPKS